MNETGDRTPDGADDEDDLLRTIRQMVSDEADRPVKQPPSHLPPPAEENGLSEAAAPAPTAPPQPLVLGAMARVDHGGSGGKSHTTSTADDPALRGMIADVVREELELVLGETLGPRIRQLVRRELADFLARAKSDGNG